MLSQGLKAKKSKVFSLSLRQTCLPGFAYLSIFGGHVGAAYWIILAAMATSATIIETIANKLDDNLLVPVFAGIIGEALIFFLPIIGIMV